MNPEQRNDCKLRWVLEDGLGNSTELGDAKRTSFNSGIPPPHSSSSVSPRFTTPTQSPRNSLPAQSPRVTNSPGGFLSPRLPSPRVVSPRYPQLGISPRDHLQYNSSQQQYHPQNQQLPSNNSGQQYSMESSDHQQHQQQQKELPSLSSHLLQQPYDNSVTLRPLRLPDQHMHDS